MVNKVNNDMIFNKYLLELIQKHEGYTIDNPLRKAVQKYDELTLYKRNELTKFAHNINVASEFLEYNLDSNRVNVAFYYNKFKEFVIDTIIENEYITGNTPIYVKHIYANTMNIIKIERNYHFGYIPVVNLIDMKEAYTNETLNKQALDYIVSQINGVNSVLERIYTKSLRKD